MPKSPRSKLSATNFRQSSLNCPRCRHEFLATPSHCPNCQYHLNLTRQLLPYTPPPLLPVNDFTETLPPDDLHQLNTSLLNLSKKFPQLKNHIALSFCPPNVAANELALWMLNDCPLHENEDPRSLPWRTLYLLDPLSGQHSFQAAYAAEPFFDRTEIEIALRSTHPHYREGQWLNGIEKFLTLLESTFHSSFKTSNRRLKKIRKKQRRKRKA